MAGSSCVSPRGLHKYRQGLRSGTLRLCFQLGPSAGGADAFEPFLSRAVQQPENKLSCITYCRLMTSVKTFQLC